jgi:predicted DCC family thiol-disulfide oxidoreductase YuxK
VQCRCGRSEVRIPATTIVFFDGVCGLCNRLNRFLLRRDRDARLRFAALQSPIARQLLAAHGLDPSDLDTVYVMAGWRTDAERVLSRSRAVLYALGELGGPWRVLARAGAIVPRPLADLVYRAAARSRYRLFGRFDACQIPPPEWRERFLNR